MNRRANSSVRRGAAILPILALLAATFAVGISAQSMKAGSKSAAKLSEEQRILHVLNRLGFGARPGDVERVKAMGLQKYIDQQLDPSSIDDSALEAKVKNLEVMNLSTADLFAKYPNPGALLRQLEGGKAAQANAQANPDEMTEKD